MITLVLGGARSGKSQFAESRAASTGGPVVYVATATVYGDTDFDQRVRRHQERRPADWSTAEVGSDLVEYLESHREGTVLVDSLGTWISGLPRFEVDAARLCQALGDRTGSTYVVSEEVGLGVHPSTEVGGRFRDALGSLNQAVAAVADQVYLVIAGRALPLAAPGDRDPGAGSPGDGSPGDGA